jgi:hypothetical protein
MTYPTVRWLALLFVVTLLACDGPAGPSLAGITIVSGNEQLGKAGESLAEPFVVQLTDGDGEPTTIGMRVIFSVVVGSGGFWTLKPGDGGWDDWGTPAVVSSDTTMTDRDGLARARFIPTDIGPSIVRASRGAHEVLFTMAATVRVISMGDNVSSWNCPGFFVAAPRCTNEVTVPIGIPVEWVNHSSSEHSVVSSSIPDGGHPFDSGMLKEGDRFRFTPSVSGIWEFTDPVTGSSGTLSVRDP